MRYLLYIPFLWCGIFLARTSIAQDIVAENSNMAESPLFLNQKALPLKMRFSSQNIRKNTNDSTYIVSTLFYRRQESAWDSMTVSLRARGNFRRENCYYLPLKMKLYKEGTRGTEFEGNQELKVVLPCLTNRDTDDYILKEYMAYKLYEIISPYHFKTRLALIEFIEERGSREKRHSLKGILIEDIDNVAARVNGKEIERLVHPLQQEPISSLHNSFFQFLIGNTDYSTKQQHNEKLLFINNNFVCIPYDFDMSGLVNADYAFVANIQNMSRKITEVTQRLYKGYQREATLLEEVRRDYIRHKPEMMQAVDALKDLFNNPRQYLMAREYVEGFFEILENDKKFHTYIASAGRLK